MSYQWVASVKRYRDTTTGRFVAASTVVQLRDDYVAARQDAMAALANRLADGDLPVNDWLRAMRDEVKLLTVAEYSFGRGGTNAMTSSDRGRVGALVRSQYEYLQRFAQDISDGKLSPEQARARARLYGAAATAAYHRGQAASYQLKLDRYPGDGHTRCLTSCRCHLEISETDDEWRVRWITNPDAEHCDDCRNLAAEWAPLVVAKPTT